MTALDITPVPEYSHQARLDGKVFVVFGAGNGIGRQSAHALAQLGANVACVGRSVMPTEHVANEIGGLSFIADVTQRDACEELFQKVKQECGRVDGVVDIVALNRPVAFMDLREDDWNWQLHNVVLHAVHAIQIGGPMIAESGGGSITLVGSLAGIMATTGALHYGIFKAALHHLALISGVQLGPLGVRVNCVAPGLTITPRLLELFGEEKVAEMAKEYPLGRMPEASDIASAILFLASPMARNITSQVLVVDGGASARAAPPITPPLGLR